MTSSSAFTTWWPFYPGLLVCALCALGGKAPAQSKAMEPLPQILLHFDDTNGTPIDSSGQEHEVANSGARAGATGKFGKAYEFDGKTSHVNAGNNFGNSFAFPAMTIECWICPKDTGKDATLLGAQEKPDGGSWRWNVVRNADGTVSFNIYDNQQTPPTRTITGKTVAEPEKWTHIAVALDCGAAQRMRLFINGREEDAGPLKSCTPYGSLFIGSGRAGFFAGGMDEVALYDQMLADDILARHASGKAPIPDGASEASRPGFRVAPVDATAWVTVRHSAFPGKSWRLRIPEYAYRDPETNRTTPPSGVVWERKADGSLEFRWDGPEELKKRLRLDYWGRVKAGADVIEFELTGKNVGDKPWGEEPWGGVLILFCFQSGGNPEFHDYEARRTYCRRDGRWITMNEVVGGKFKPHRMCGFRFKRDGKPGAERLAAKVSKDGQWALGIATDIAGSLSFNFQLRASCMHSNPVWPDLRPGEEATAKGRIYLIRGGLDDLWRRYEKDLAP